MTNSISYPADCRLPDTIYQAGLDGQLVLFVGAGVSRRMGLPDWNGLAAKVLEDLRGQSFLNYAAVDQLKGLDAKKQLSIAYDVAKQNGYEISLRELLGEPSGDSQIYFDLNKIGCTCVTTNYDELLEPTIGGSSGKTTTAAKPDRIVGVDKLMARHLDKPGTVIHIHGSVSDKESIVATTKSYLEHYDHKNTQEFLKQLFTRKVVLFIGYGLEEAEILEHILRRGDARSTGELKRFAIQGFFKEQATLFESLQRYYANSFGVELIGFARDEDDYAALDQVINNWSSKLQINAPALVEDLQVMDEVLADE